MSDLLNQASLVMVPSGYKEDTVYSVVPSDGAGDLSFTRASNGTRVNSAGLVEVCPWNLLEQSEDFSNGVWVKTNTTATTNTTTAPNGTTTADSLLETTATGDHRLWERPALISGQDYTFTIYVKQNGRKRFQIKIFDSSSVQASALFDVSTGTIVATNGTSSIENVGNGWYRCSIVATSPTSSTGYTVLDLATDSYSQSTASDSYAGDASKGVYIWGAQLNIGSTAKPYFPTTDRLNVPRLTYQNGGGGCPSLLLEKQSTNILLYSEQFDNAVWTQYQGGTITANTVISPDGTQNAETLTVASGQTYSGIYQSVSGSNDVYTVSIFAKQNTKRFIYLFDASASAAGWFDLQNGVLGTIPSGYTGSIENFGNGWFRCIFKKNSAVTPAFFQIGLADADGFSTPSSSGSSYIWGAQLEASSYVTSYIPTTSSSATRVADACYKTGISSLIGQTEGTIFIDCESFATASTNVLFMIGDGTTNNRVEFYWTGANNGTFVVGSGGTIQVLTSVGLIQAQRNKIAVVYKANDFAIYANGVALATASSGSVPTSFTAIEFGEGSSFIYMGKINQVCLFKTRLTNAELASITSL